MKYVHLYIYIYTLLVNTPRNQLLNPHMLQNIAFLLVNLGQLSELQHVPHGISTTLQCRCHSIQITCELVIDFPSKIYKQYIYIYNDVSNNI